MQVHGFGYLGIKGTHRVTSKAYVLELNARMASPQALEAITALVEEVNVLTIDETRGKYTSATIKLTVDVTGKKDPQHFVMVTASDLIAAVKAKCAVRTPNRKLTYVQQPAGRR